MGPLELAWRLAVMGAGLALFLGPTQTMAMTGAAQHLLATTGASTNVARQLGIALGPALATLLWSASGYTVSGMRVSLALAAALAVLGAVPLLIRGRPGGIADTRTDRNREPAASRTSQGSRP